MSAISKCFRSKATWQFNTACVADGVFLSGQLSTGASEWRRGRASVCHLLAFSCFSESRPVASFSGDSQGICCFFSHPHLNWRAELLSGGLDPICKMMQVKGHNFPSWVISPFICCVLQSETGWTRSSLGSGLVTEDECYPAKRPLIFCYPNVLEKFCPGLCCCNFRFLVTLWHLHSHSSNSVGFCR